MQISIRHAHEVVTAEAVAAHVIVMSLCLRWRRGYCVVTNTEVCARFSYLKKNKSNELKL